MKKLAAAGILGAMLMANASAEVLHFAYKGFYDRTAKVYKADATITGFFAADDRNLDGIFSRDELNELRFDGYQVEIGCHHSDPFYSCLDEFSYSASAGLDIQTHAGQWDTWAMTVDTGVDYTWQEQYGDTVVLLRNYEWTPETQFFVSTSPIPEPASVAMLGVGLATLMLARRRHAGHTAQ